MTLRFPSSAPNQGRLPPLAPMPDPAVPPTTPISAHACDTTIASGHAMRPEFFSVAARSRRPADLLASRTANTMLAIYRAKYGLDVATAAFRGHAAKAAELRAWCDSLKPGSCGWALASTPSGIHTFSLAVGRSEYGVPFCLLVDSMGVCMSRIVAELDHAFDGRLYVTPQIQRSHQLGCIVFAMRFLLMTRSPGLAEKVLKTVEDFDVQYRDAMPAVRQLSLEDTWRLSGWLAATQLRRELDKPDFLMTRPLENGGRHAAWTVRRFFDERPASLTQDVRQMYREVDLLVNDPSRSLVSAERRAYLHKRFLKHLEPEPVGADG